ncbi:hypothetical protein GF339_14520 [candidate division KSB3 bacterium]|uniref:Uncharacterized protein n=1 Tax=candidate division KSB3 bacterium TaxID=2044937 RepID=A0A9D5JY19_9BACT|nr:hypothetical protein [candidate division KSB3 bacterium]MBD3325796.1 hypothetical protein [candidate division KSB3 bacterium]
MSDYQAVYEKRFVKNLARYASLRRQIRRCVDWVLETPYTQTEFLGDSSGKLNLKGCRAFVLIEISASSLSFVKNAEGFLNMSIAFVRIFQIRPSSF